MFFNEHPDTFFPQTQIDIVHFPEGRGADVFKEKIIKGPIHKMLSEALSYIKNQIIIEKVKKIEGQAEAERYFNYPFEALEEIITNAVYHRSYEIREPVEIRIFPESIQISSFPGPDRSILKNDIEKFKFISRRYRNRRIGEFLKELEMTEGRGTGIPKIMREIKKNNSPDPIFHTDEDRSYLVVEIHLHPEFIEENEVTTEVTTEVATEVTTEVTAEVKKLVEVIEGEMTRRELQNSLGLKNDGHFRKRYIVPAIDMEVLEMTISENPNSRLQKYRLTEKGKQLKNKLQ